MLDNQVIEMTEGLRTLLKEKITAEVKKSGGRVDIDVTLPVIDLDEFLVRETIDSVYIKRGATMVHAYTEYQADDFETPLGGFSVDELIKIMDAL